MYVASIRIKKFRHLENESFGPFGKFKGSELIAFAGPNGSGKSSVLELLSYALSNTYSLSWQLARTFSDFAFEVGIGLTREETQIVSEGLNQDLVAVEAQVALQKADIYERSDLETAGKETLFQQAAEQLRRPYKHLYAAQEYLKSSSVYFRSFNFEEGEQAKDPTLHNQLHQIVSRELKERLKRSLGFFLRADRHYPQKGFDQRKIFGYENVRRTEHLWSMAFNTSEIQYQDMYEFLVQLRYHYLRELGSFHSRRNKGQEAGEEPVDPIQPYEELLQRLFPQYKFADVNETVPSNLYVEIPSGEVITFNDLSSGEKEVFFILSFFIRHNVENAIVVIDEPELHLHPELSRLLLRNMRSIRNGNQIWVATHNAEIVDEAGRDRVVYATRDPVTRKSKFVSAQDEQAAFTQLRDLFGLSGYIGVARNLVFLEGDNSSQDRKAYGALFPNNSTFKLIPAKSSDHTRRINSAVLSILEANVASMNFFLIRDRDYLTDEMAAKYASHGSGRIHVLKRHEVENYLLDSDSISEVLEELFGIEQSSSTIQNLLHDAAIELSSAVIRDMTAFRLNLNARPQDFSVGRLLKGQPYFSQTPSGLQELTDRGAVLRGAFVSAGESVRASVQADLSRSVIEAELEKSAATVKEALAAADWLTLFPGKEMFELLCRRIGVHHPIALQNAVIKQLAANPERIDAELSELFLRIEQS